MYVCRYISFISKWNLHLVTEITISLTEKSLNIQTFTVQLKLQEEGHSYIVLPKILSRKLCEVLISKKLK